ncbi:hypothetical protein ARMSODRAFT_164940 [Armillaria solidipes]|uniref:Uncharacterized protein n=1 Tax=Armillaria solidipes TaxID=1076256 RepID=A0A2H3C003_9AGAR|nr:hypothetical protein ARMSODRAFT_164940 [Armillaria solidipes]
MRCTTANRSWQAVGSRRSIHVRTYWRRWQRRHYCRRVRIMNVRAQQALTILNSGIIKPSISPVPTHFSSFITDVSSFVTPRCYSPDENTPFWGNVGSSAGSEW